MNMCLLLPVYFFYLNDSWAAVNAVLIINAWSISSSPLYLFIHSDSFSLSLPFLPSLSFSLSLFPSGLNTSIQPEKQDMSIPAASPSPHNLTFSSLLSLSVSLHFSLSSLVSSCPYFFTDSGFHMSRAERGGRNCSLLVLISLLQSVGEHNAWAALGSDTVCDSHRWKTFKHQL